MFSFRGQKSKAVAGPVGQTSRCSNTTTDALLNLKRTAAAMHQENENSRQSERLWREKLEVSMRLAEELDNKLNSERTANANLQFAISESVQSLIDS
jgi:hypothetical protein